MSKYSSGRNFEYEIKHLLEAAGFQVTRAAGSHGLYDLIAVKHRGGKVYEIGMLQLKATRSGGALPKAAGTEHATG